MNDDQKNDDYVPGQYARELEKQIARDQRNRYRKTVTGVICIAIFLIMLIGIPFYNMVIGNVVNPPEPIPEEQTEEIKVDGMTGYIEPKNVEDQLINKLHIQTVYHQGHTYVVFESYRGLFVIERK